MRAVVVAVCTAVLLVAAPPAEAKRRPPVSCPRPVPGHEVCFPLPVAR